MTSYYNTKKKILIVEEIKRWIADVLSVPSDHFNGMPPCPYAKQAWVNGKVKVDFGGQGKIIRTIDDWPDECDIVIMVVPDDWKYSDVEDWCDQENEHLAKDDFVVIPFVPGSRVESGQPDEELEDWDPLVEEEYAMVFIQSLSELETASAHLMSKGYYKNCTEQFMEYVNKRSERYGNARIQEGHEEGFEEEDRQEDAAVGHEEDEVQEEVIADGKEENSQKGSVREHSRETQAHQGGERREDAQARIEGCAD